MNNDNDTTSSDGHRPAGRWQALYRRGLAHVESAWRSLSGRPRDCAEDPATIGRVPRGAVAVGLAATLSAAAVTTAAAVPWSPDDGPDKPTGPPAITAKAGTVQQKIVTAARDELGTREVGDDCQKYSEQCVAWCALFATSMWEEAGVPVDSENFAFTGDVYTTGQAKGKSYDSGQLDQVRPGDVLLFGTGPQSPSTSKHVGVVEKVQGDTVTLIEGNTGDNPDRVMRKEHKLSPATFYGGVHPW